MLVECVDAGGDSRSSPGDAARHGARAAAPHRGVQRFFLLQHDHLHSADNAVASHRWGTMVAGDDSNTADMGDNEADVDDDSVPCIHRELYQAHHYL